METILFILSIASFIHEISGIRKKRFSFIFRYFIVLLLFKNIDVFNNEWLNFWLTEMISIGFIIYVIISLFIIVVIILLIQYFLFQFYF